MSPRTFDCFMVQVGVGTNRKLRRLPVAQRWAYVAGVLSLAAQSPMRGALLIHDGEPATEHDVAEEATIPLKDARAALSAFRRLGMLERDHEGVEWVHDWDELNPDPKPSDSPEARRQRKRDQRARRANGHADVTRDKGVTSRGSHTPEVEVEEKTPPNPPTGGRQRDKDRFKEQVRSYVADCFPGLPQGEAVFAVSQAIDRGARSDGQVREHIAMWFPKLSEQLDEGAAA